MGVIVAAGVASDDVEPSLVFDGGEPASSLLHGGDLSPNPALETEYLPHAGTSFGSRRTVRHTAQGVEMSTAPDHLKSWMLPMVSACIRGCCCFESQSHRVPRRKAYLVCT